MYFLASTVLSGLVTMYGMDPQVGQPLDGFSFSPCSALCLGICSCECFVPPPKKDHPIYSHQTKTLLWMPNPDTVADAKKCVLTGA